MLFTQFKITFLFSFSGQGKGSLKLRTVHSLLLGGLDDDTSLVGFSFLLGNRKSHPLESVFETWFADGFIKMNLLSAIRRAFFFFS